MQASGNRHCMNHTVPIVDRDQCLRLRTRYRAKMKRRDGSASDQVRLFLAGDVMLGRGVDQILPTPCDPAINESCLRSAIEYVDLAERSSGPIPRPADGEYIWGAVLEDLNDRDCDLRIVNLETAITRRGRPAPKDVNYRMSPENASVLRTARIDACTLANNHVLDWGEAGLLDTLATLDNLGVPYAGAGRTNEEANEPRLCRLPNNGRLILIAFGHRSAGVPDHWEAGPGRPGILLLPDLPERATALINARVAPIRKPGDLVLLSVHWGGNWGYDIPEWQRRMAHAMIDTAGADLVFGHSSHHPKGMEIFHEKLILYGCGDLINDYEGIGGQEEYRPDLGAAFLIDLEAQTGRLIGIEIIPYMRRGFSLVRAEADATIWLADMLNKESQLAGRGFERTEAGTLRLCPTKQK